MPPRLNRFDLHKANVRREAFEFLLLGLATDKRHLNRVSDLLAMHALTPKLQTLREQLHDLLSIFMASRQISLRLCQEDMGTLEAVSLQTIEDAIIRKRLLAVAVSLRVLDDQTDLSQDMFVGECGTLLVDATSPDTMIGLSLREACNKLIHAEAVTLERDNLTPLIRCLEPYLHLRGSNQAKTKEWGASISVYEFVRAGLVAARRYAPSAGEEF